MKKNILYIFMIFLFASCSKSEQQKVENNKKGELCTSFSVKGEVASDELPLNIEIYSVSDEGVKVLVKKWNSYLDVPEIIELEVGDYFLISKTGDSMAEIADKPFLYCEKSFSVNEKLATYLKVECTILNMQVSVELSEAMKLKYPQWKAELFYIEDAERVIATIENNNSTKIYINPKAFGVRLIDISTSNSKTIIIDNVAPATHQKVVFE